MNCIEIVNNRIPGTNKSLIWHWIYFLILFQITSLFQFRPFLTTLTYVILNLYTLNWNNMEEYIQFQNKDFAFIFCSSEKKEFFLLENASNLTHEFLHDNFKKILLNFYVKIFIQNLMCQIWCIFKDKLFIFFLKRKC